VVLLSPYLPLLFMGEEYGEPAPFHYFVSHSDEKVIESVRRGRRLELAAFAWREEPPDPQEVTTFEASKLDWALRDKGEHAALLALHRELLRLRREHPALANRSKRAQTVTLEGRVLAMRRRSADGGWEASAVFNLSPEPAAAPGRGTIFLHSADERWAGPGVPTDGGLPPYAFLIVERRG
jgi:maltooligosyltrehalose trehalohydrolase